MFLAEKKLFPEPHLTEIPPQATGLIVLDTEIVAQNYRAIQVRTAKGAKVAGVVKADGYGLGMTPIANRLFEASCRDFFVATLDEGIRLRTFFKDKEAHIYVLGGVLKDTEFLFAHHKLTPVLISLSQVHRWVEFARIMGKKLDAILHIDTGMSRTGLAPEECESLEDAFHQLNILYIMSHLASADDPRSEQNEEQLQLFHKILQRLPKIHYSFGNSWGTALGAAYHGDLIRPGIGLFGLVDLLPETQSAITLSARVIQTRRVKAGQPIGYNATHRCTRPTRLATLGVGYADGILRALGNKGHLSIEGFHAPIVGNISMDFMVIDVTEVPEGVVEEGNWVDLYKTREDFLNMARSAQTAVYELLVRLGQRYQRVYL